MLPHNALSLFIFFSTFLFLTGCLGVKDTADSSRQLIRGAVNYSQGEFTITPCYSQERRKLQDKRGLVKKRYREQTPEGSLPVYMELRASPLTDLSWDVSDVQVAGGGSNACEFDLIGIQYRAAGSDPLWIADVLTDSVRVQSYDNLRTLTFPLSLSSGSGGIWEGALKSVKNRTHRFRLEILDQSCRDKHNAWYRWTASLDLDGDLFYGCAREGDLTSRSVKGRYSNDLTQENVFVVLDLLDDQKASMLLDYRNGQPLIVMNGVWKWKSSDTLLLEFSEQDGRQQQSFLLLRRTVNGFVQQGFSSEFGRAGLSLSRSE